MLLECGGGRGVVPTITPSPIPPTSRAKPGHRSATGEALCHNRRPAVGPTRRTSSLCGRCRKGPGARAPYMIYVFLFLASTTVISTAQAGSIGGGGGGGQNVPWWYPSEIWGTGDRDAVAGEDPWRQSSTQNGDDGVKGDRSSDGGLREDVSLRRFRETALLAKEFVGDCVAFGVAEDEERTGFEPSCSVHEGANATLRRLGENIDRCASPFYSLTEIYPSQLVYTEVDPAQEAKAAREAEAELRRKAKARGRVQGTDSGGAGGNAPAEEMAPVQEDSFLGIFLFLKDDFFSVELENSLTTIAPAYPRAWLVKADAKTFLSFCVQYHLYTFPQLLLFKNGRFISRFRGRRLPKYLAAWLSLHTGDLPKAAPRRPLPPPPLPNPLTLPGIDDPVAWAALLYAGIKFCMAVSWLFKRRNRGAEGTGEAGRRLLGLAGRIKRMIAWIASRLVWRRRRAVGAAGQARYHTRRVREEPGNGEAGGPAGSNPGVGQRDDDLAVD